MVCVGSTHPTEQHRTRAWLLATSSTVVEVVAGCMQHNLADIDLHHVDALPALMARIDEGLVDVAMIHVAASAYEQDPVLELWSLPSRVPVVALCDQEDEALLAHCFALGVQECLGLPGLNGAQLARVLRFAHIRGKVALGSGSSPGQSSVVCEQVVAAMDDGVVVLDPEGRVAFCNPAAQRLLGAELSTVAAQLSCAGAAIDVAEPVERTLPDGRVVGLSTAAIPWMGGPARLLLVRDNTDRSRSVGALRRANRRLARTNSRLVESGQNRDELVANAAHDLRTPLTALRNALDVMDRPSVGGLTERQGELRGVALRNVDRLAGHIEDLLELSRLEAGQERLYISAFSLTDAVRDAATAVLPLAAAKSIVLTVNADDNLPRFVGDRTKIDRVVTNLLTNAIKFTSHSGRVSVEVCGSSEGESDAHPPTVTVTVTDTGIGIAADQLAQVFDRFHRGADPRAWQQRGTGLGLAIVRRLAHLHQGDVAVTSTPECGTAFTVTLPRLFADDFVSVQLGNSLLRARSTRQPLSLVYIQLLAEDDEADRHKLVEAIRAQVEATLHRHCDGVYTRRRSGELFAALPQTSRARTAAVLARIRAGLATLDLSEQGRARKPSPALLLGACTFPHDGVELDRLLARAAASATPVRVGLRPSLFDILLIDDHDTRRTLVLHLLAEEDYTVRTARDGPEGLAMACSQPPDLVILNVSMRGVDGREVFEVIGDRAPLAHVPVLVLGGEGCASVERLCAGRPSVFLTRPFTKRALLDGVQRLLELRTATGRHTDGQQDPDRRRRRGHSRRRAARHGGGRV